MIVMRKHHSLSPKKDASIRASEKSAIISAQGHRILLRDIARNDDTVTLISCITIRKLSSYDTSALTISGHTSNILSEEQAYLILGYLNSRIADFLIRPF